MITSEKLVAITASMISRVASIAGPLRFEVFFFDIAGRYSPERQ